MAILIILSKKAGLKKAGFLAYEIFTSIFLRIFVFGFVTGLIGCSIDILISSGIGSFVRFRHIRGIGTGLIFGLHIMFRWIFILIAPFFHIHIAILCPRTAATQPQSSQQQKSQSQGTDSFINYFHIFIPLVNNGLCGDSKTQQKHPGLTGYA
jgi:hypothetical protein